MPTLIRCMIAELLRREAAGAPECEIRFELKRIRREIERNRK